MIMGLPFAFDVCQTPCYTAMPKYSCLSMWESDLAKPGL